jgi:hypothetical protein
MGKCSTVDEARGVTVTVLRQLDEHAGVLRIIIMRICRHKCVAAILGPPPILIVPCCHI